MKSVKDDTVLITGAASGIGRLMAIKFAGLGAKKIVLLDRDTDNLQKVEATVREARKNPDRQEIYSVVADLATRTATCQAMDESIEKAGDITMLINNAGIVTGKKITDCPGELMELTMRVNSESHFWTTQAVLPKMIEKNRGHIVTISSAAGVVGVPGLADYSASKHAAKGFDESIRLEMRLLGKTGVKTTVVCPFYIRTGMFEGAKSRYPIILPLLQPEYAVKKILQAIRCNQSVLKMPMSTHLLPVMRALLPTPLFDEFCDWTGSLESMDDFKGRAKQTT